LAKAPLDPCVSGSTFADAQQALCITSVFLPKDVACSHVPALHFFYLLSPKAAQQLGKRFHICV
jgi:hypothetical protein